MNTKGKWYIIIFLCAVSFFMVSSCKGPQGDIGPTGPQGEKGNPGENGTPGDYDKQVRLDIGQAFGINYRPPDTLWHLSDTLSHTLFRFNKENYVNADSIIFECEAGSFDDTTMCYVRLYDLTDKVPVYSSEVFVTGSDFKIVSSGNIFSELPGKEITIGIETRTNMSGNSIYSDRFTLYLFRN